MMDSSLHCQFNYWKRIKQYKRYKMKLEDKITTREEWLKMVPHESEAEVPPVPTYKQILDYVYETALKR